MARLKRPTCARDAARAVDWALPDLAQRGGLEWTIGLHADKAADLNNLFGGAADALQVSGWGSPRAPPGPARAVFPLGSSRRDDHERKLYRVGPNCETWATR